MESTSLGQEHGIQEIETWKEYVWCFQYLALLLICFWFAP